jgi:hypothetical protein
MAVLLATALGALCTRLSGGAGGPLAPQTLADQFGAAKLADIKAAVAAGATIAGCQPSVYGSAHLYVPQLEGGNFAAVRNAWGFKRGKNPPFFDPEPLAVLERAGGVVFVIKSSRGQSDGVVQVVEAAPAKTRKPAKLVGFNAIAVVWLARDFFGYFRPGMVELGFAEDGRQQYEAAVHGQEGRDRKEEADQEVPGPLACALGGWCHRAAVRGDRVLAG